MSMGRVEQGDVNLRGQAAGAGAAYGGTRFMGRVNAVGCEFGERVDFANCVFEQPVTFHGAQFLRGVNFTNAVFKAPAIFTACRFVDRAYFWRARFHGPADFSQMIVRVDENAAPDFIFPGEANFSWTWFFDQVTFRRAHFHGPAYFWRTLFLAGANFEETRFKGEAQFYGRIGDVQIARNEFSAPTLLDALQAAGVLAGDDEMYLQLDGRRQYLIFLFQNAGTEQQLADTLRAMPQPQIPPALVDELLAAWRAGAKPMFSDPVHVSWRGARFEKPAEVEFTEVGLDIPTLSQGAVGAPRAGRPGDFVLASGDVAQLQAALVDAFDRDTLDQVVYFAVQERLAKIVPPGSLKSEVFNLLIWANENSKVAALLREAIREVPDNAALKQFAEYARAKWPGVV
ncbi:MAG: pentapeptide repeat-containing protein [Caldilineaceae bacterium]